MVCLNALTEYQKSLLTRFSYLNIDYKKYLDAKAFMGQINLSDLKTLISDPDELYIGSLHMPRLKKMITHIDTTTMQFIEMVEEAGLGDLEIVDYIDENGFNAICFKDKDGRKGFSFRGTDLKTFSSFASDGLADLEAFLTNTTKQIIQADTLFNKHKNLLGHNYLYGHSLGGFLAESVYLKNYEDIANTFVINPFHINSELIDDDSKLEAFNNSDKFSCFVIGGDYVSFINQPILFEENIHYIKNSERTANNPFGNHMVEAGLFDIDGNFIESNEEEAFEGHLADRLNDAIQFIQEEPVKEFMSNIFITIKNYLSSLKIHLRKIFKKPKEPVIENAQEINRKWLSDFDEYLNIDNYSRSSITQEKRIRRKREEKEIEDIR